MAVPWIHAWPVMCLAARERGTKAREAPRSHSATLCFLSTLCHADIEPFLPLTSHDMQLGLSYTPMYNVYSSLSSVPLYSPHHSTMTACTEHDVSRLKSNSAWWRLGPDFRWDRESNTVFDCLTNRPDAVLQLMHTNADAAVYVWVFIYTSLFRQVAANR